ncbi:MAG: molecular chaperone HtpG [Planctomycetota bacterium]
MSATQHEKHAFAAEVDQVLSIVVNSLYSHREVFLRELVSNASDALDKLSFRALTDHALMGDDKDLRIEIAIDEKAKTLTLSDNGVGMSRDELVSNLGTIARSGSRELMNALRAKNESGDLSLIGQFGVGFYSAFLVADRVTVVSRQAGSNEAWRWESEAKDGFTIEATAREGRGTDIVLHLKDDCAEYLQSWSVRTLIRKYSDYVRHPIRMQVERDGKQEWETVNQANALWTRPRNEISTQQYHDFYRHLSHDWSEPLAWTHFKVEGVQSLTGLLFVPSQPPLDLFDRKNKGIRLFVKRVFIMEDCQELLPDWLRFLRGVVDSEDLPLNVSREILQQDRVTRQIRKQVVKKTLALLEELANEGTTTVEEGDGDDKTTVERNRYHDFWKNFGIVLKEGIHTEAEHRDELARLLRYESTREDGLTSLHDYVARMQPDQPGIYYVTGESVATCRNSPQLEALRKRGYEVLYLGDPVDEWVVRSLTEFEDKKLIDATKGALDLPESETEKKEREQKAADLADVVTAMKTALGDEVKDVRVSSRLADSPACLVGDEGDLSPHLERILRSHGQEMPEQKRILELNPDHRLIRAIQKMAARDGAGEQVGEWSQLLLEQARLSEGTLPTDPAGFARKIASLMGRVAEQDAAG